VACPFEVSILRPASSVRSPKVRLAVGVPDMVSWVLPTSMALITLESAKKRGWICGKEVENRLRLGAEMLLDRACPESGWNAGNAVVYGVPLRPHIDATALALAALRFHYGLPVVRNSLTWDVRSHGMLFGVQLGVDDPCRRRAHGREGGRVARDRYCVQSSRRTGRRSQSR
jgi:hypothetical protein